MVAHAITLSVVNSNSANQIYNVAENNFTETKWVNWIKERMKWEGTIEFIPPISKGLNFAQNLDMDSEKIRKELGYSEKVLFESKEVNILESFTERVIGIIQQIPSGRVMTYGQIARMAGSPRGARQVVRILHSMSAKYYLPWHRVINAKGEIGIKDDESFFYQKTTLQNEGITFINGSSLNLEDYQFFPQQSSVK